MGWFKRNLFFVIGVAVAIGLLGAAGYYDYASWSHNQTALVHLNEIYSKLSDLNGRKPSPGNGQVDNIATAKEQERQLRQWVDQTKSYFQPIAPIPAPTNGPLSSELFAGAVHRTIAQLQREAAAANVALPPDYGFSFTAHKDRLTFAPGSLDPLAVQLGEVKAISELLFGVGINALDGIQRVTVSPDDMSGPQTDYLTELPVTNDLAVLVPYQITFRAFSPEIAQTLKAFATSQNAFIVKTISVQPAGASGAPAASPSYGGVDPIAPPPSTPPTPSASMPSKGGWQTVLNEQLLRVTLTIELVKLAPRN